MIVDSSAIIAVAFREPGWESVLAKIADGGEHGMGAPTVVEAGMVLARRRGRDSGALMTQLLGELGIDVVPFVDDHWRTALRAFRDFGKGQHAAGLNFGDCLSYATAKVAGEPLLFTGDDFAKTDITAA